MSFPPGFIERVRNHTPLSEIIGSRVALKRHGREHMGLCPFHKEKTPSFTVSDDKGFYYCFGCQASGDAITFLREHEHMGYREAVEFLAREAGIPIPEFSPEQRALYQKISTLHDALEEATRYFEQQFAGSLRAKNYAASRGLKPEILAQFRVGLAPAEREGLKKYLLGKNISEQLMLDAGLIIKPDEGASYDRFRERLMFPIRDAQGRVVAFGGRIMPDAANAEHAPKYLNSPETELFHKGELLFNLDQATRSARDAGNAIVVEGYMDAIALVQAGFPQTVATLGTAITEAHLKRLWALVPEPVLCMDGDNAGKRSMLRAAELVLPHLQPGLSLRFVMLPAGEDPDTLMQKRGSGAFKACLDEATPLGEMIWEELAGYYRQKRTPEARAALENHLMKLCERMTNATVRSHYRAYFRSLLWPKGDRKNTLLQARAPEVAAMAGSDPQGRASTSCLKQMLKLVLLCPELLEQSEIEEALAHMHTEDARLEELRQKLLTCTHNEGAGIPPTDEIVQSLLEDASIFMPRNMLEEPMRAQGFAQEVLQSYRVFSLREEYSEALTKLQLEYTEQHLERVQALQQHLKTLRMGPRLAEAG